VRRSAADRREDTAGATRETCAASLRIRALIVPVWKDSVVVGSPWQANIREGGIRRRQLSVAVGGQIDAGKCGVVEPVAKRQSNSRDQIVRAVANVGGARDNRAAYLT